VWDSLQAVFQLGLPISESCTPLQRCGLDEVGRGALAGPLVAAGVILPDDIRAQLGEQARFLRDSKTVPRQRRSEMATLITQCALVVELITIPVEVINQHGIGWANREAFCQLIERISADEYIVDGKVKPHVSASVESADRSARVRCMVKADVQVPAVAAASLVAKVYRDKVMAELHQQFPMFGWDRNAGYGTVSHLAALRHYGPAPQHRTVFVRTALAGGQKNRRARDNASLHALTIDRLPLGDEAHLASS
jgi:ribonuclease HII